MIACRGAGAGVVADEQRRVEAELDALHHLTSALGPPLSELRRRVKLLGEQVPHEPVAVVDQDRSAPAASAPSIAAFASAVISRRDRLYSAACRGSVGSVWSSWTTPATPSMSTEM